MFSGLYVVVLKERFPKFPKKVKIRQYIEFPLEAQKRNSFNYLSKRSRQSIHVFRAVQKIPTHHLALFTVSDVIGRHASVGVKTNHDVFLSFFFPFLLSVAQQPNTVSAVLFLRFLDHTQLEAHSR
jgi:hypothetical protein